MERHHAISQLRNRARTGVVAATLFGIFGKGTYLKDVSEVLSLVKVPQIQSIYSVLENTISYL